MKVFDFRFNRKQSCWIWHPWAYCLGFGGWFCLNPRWLWRFIITVPRQRGWRWD